MILGPRLETTDAGWRLVGRLRAEAGTADLPIIAYSAGHRDLASQPIWLRERDCVTLAKPFTLEDLLGPIAAAVPASVSPN